MPTTPEIKGKLLKEVVALIGQGSKGKAVSNWGLKNTSGASALRRSGLC